jgi:hypothetical protein
MTPRYPVRTRRHDPNAFYAVILRRRLALAQQEIARQEAALTAAFLKRPMPVTIAELERVFGV